MPGLSYPTASTVNDVPTMDFLRYSANLTSSELADPNKAELGSNYDQNPDWSIDNDAVPFQGALSNYTRRISENQVAMYDPTGKYIGVGSTEGGGWMGKHGQDLAKIAMAAMALYGGYGAMTGAEGFAGATPASLGELGGYGVTSTEVAGAAPTLLGEAGAAGMDAGLSAWSGAESALATEGLGSIPAGMSADAYAAMAANGGGAASGAGNWLTQAYQSLLGPGTALGGAQGAMGGMGATGQGWLKPLLSIGSGLYGMSQANSMKDLAQQAISGSAPWTSSGGTAMAGDALKTAISGDLSNDPGYKLAQLGAARTSAQQPGGFAASAAANAAIKYRNETIGALSGPAGVGFNPAAGYQTAISGTSSANDLMSKSLGSIGFGMTGESQGMPPWLQAYLIKNGMGG